MKEKHGDYMKMKDDVSEVKLYWSEACSCSIVLATNTMFCVLQQQQVRCPTVDSGALDQQSCSATFLSQVLKIFLIRRHPVTQILDFDTVVS